MRQYWHSTYCAMPVILDTVTPPFYGAITDLVAVGLVVVEGGWVELAMSRLSGQHP